MSKFITLPNGDAILAEAIRAIRLGNPRLESKELNLCELKPRVTIDFLIGSHNRCIVLNCGTIEQRDELAENLKAQLQ